MNKTERNGWLNPISWKMLIGFFAFNAILISVFVVEGLNRPHVHTMAFRFEERQAGTFISALQLGLTSYTCLVIWLLNKTRPFLKSINFWLLSFCGFLYLTLDEWFMLHEGVDGALADLFRLFSERSGKLMFDGAVLVLFGLIALAVCWFSRKEILKHKQMLFFFVLGGLFFIGTIATDILKPDEVNIRATQFSIMLEESCKLFGVSYFFAGFLSVLFPLLSHCSRALTPKVSS